MLCGRRAAVAFWQRAVGPAARVAPVIYPWRATSRFTTGLKLKTPAVHTRQLATTPNSTVERGSTPTQAEPSETLGPGVDGKGAREKVFVGVSGGVDSSVAALLLKDQGYDVVGVHMTNWDGSDEAGERVCTNTEDRRFARAVCEQIGIPLIEENFVEAYWNEVFQPCMDEYNCGRTPNPDTACNSQIKFGHFLNRCFDRGADYIATGHYARVSIDDDDDGDDGDHDTSADSAAAAPAAVRHAQGEGAVRLLCGVDSTKDQSYFLSRVPGSALRHTLFPLGELTKSRVREIAAERGLCTARKKDSYGICFVGKRNFPEFLAQYVDLEPGNFVTPEGEIVGQHDGVQLYTQGQGARIAGLARRVFVAGKDLAARTVTVVEEGHPLLFASAIRVDRGEFSWVAGSEPATPAAPGGERSRRTLPAYARVRHLKPLVECRVIFPPAAQQQQSTAAHKTTNSDYFYIELAEPTSAVASGQVVALHSFDDPSVCLGGGTIVSAQRDGVWSDF